jgi:hypothetical protein
MDWRDVIGAAPREEPSQSKRELPVEPSRVTPTAPPSFAQRVRIAELRLNATQHRMDAGMRDALRHSVEHLRFLASGARDEHIADQMLTAFEAQLRREMKRGS